MKIGLLNFALEKVNLGTLQKSVLKPYMNFVLFKILTAYMYGHHLGGVHSMLFCIQSIRIADDIPSSLEHMEEIT